MNADLSAAHNALCKVNAGISAGPPAIDLYFAKVGTAGAGHWRMATEEDSIVCLLENGVHPNAIGANQIGDAIWAFFKYWT